jgi:hypothetical protein
VQELKALQGALKSGSISDAQAALTAFQNDLATGSWKTATKVNSLSKDSPVSQDMASLQSALDSNDISSAQQAFMSLKHDLHAMKHHHRMGMQQDKGGLSTASGGTTDSSTAAGTMLDTQA